MPAEPLRIVFLITNLAYGGAPNQMVRVAVQLRARGWEVYVAAMMHPEGHVKTLKEAGIPVETLGIQRSLPDPRVLLRLAALLRRWKPHILNSYLFHANLLARLARPLCRVPVLISSVRTLKEPQRWREPLYRATDFLCDGTTQNSTAGAERYVRIGAVPRHKMHMIPNGIDIERFCPNPDIRRAAREALGVAPDRFVWLAAGHVEFYKDYPGMVRALAELAPAYPQARLFVAGEGSQIEAVEALAVSLGVGDRVRLLGLRQDMPALMNAADGYVMASIWEGMPNVLLEASASGLPVVATRVSDNAAIVLDGESGVLVPPRDPAALAAAMQRVMALPSAARQRMGRAGRSHIEKRYGLERVTDLWEDLYTTLFHVRRGEKR